MFFNKLLVLLSLTLPCVSATAAQDDARVLVRKPTFLFDGNRVNETGFLSDVAFNAGFGNYFDTDHFHSWRFGAGFDTAVLSFSDQAIWRFGLNMDVIADSHNSIHFRIAQTQYEVFSAFEFKLEDSVWYLGYRHRCRHGADDTDSRIIMKTGPEFGFNGLNRVGPFDIIWTTSLTTYLYGQNEDLSHQHRLNLSASAQVEYPIWERIGIFASAAVSTIWVTQSNHKEYVLFSSPSGSDLRISPGASFGVNFRGGVGEVRTFLAYASNLDAGFRSEAQQTHLVSINAEMWF